MEKNTYPDMEAVMEQEARIVVSICRAVQNLFLLAAVFFLFLFSDCNPWVFLLLLLWKAEYNVFKLVYKVLTAKPGKKDGPLYKEDPLYM